MSEPVGTGPIVVGLQPGYVSGVVEVAASYAARLGSSLVCVSVDPAFVDTGTRDDGSEMLEPLDSDTDDSAPRTLSASVEEEVRAVAARAGVTVELLAGVGDPARALIRAAEQRDAPMLVIGSRSGARRIAEFFSGSVAAQLVHHQHRPVLVIPTDPIGLHASPPQQDL